MSKNTTIPEKDSFIPTSDQSPYVQPVSENNFFSGVANFLKPISDAYLDYEMRDAEIDAIRSKSESGKVEQSIPTGNTAPKAKAPKEGFVNPQNMTYILIAVAVGVAVVLMVRK